MNIHRCESASWCRLEASSDVFNHTCDDVTVSYLEVEYTCQRDTNDDDDKDGERKHRCDDK